jgi:catechol 2,3-dioxygenase-like lactoylglutathione lyase family enzyme
VTIVFQRTIPILRIFSVEKAKEFYVDYLGFTVDWEHHFEDDTPAYL